MSVTKAQFEQKGEAFVARQANKKAAKKKLEKLERRALGWGGFDDTLKPQQVGAALLLGTGRTTSVVGWEGEEAVRA